MLYAIFGQDVANSLEKRLSGRAAHLARLEALQNAGRLILAGPFPAVDAPEPGVAGYSGSLIVAEFESLQAAETWAAADPYIAAGVYQQLAVRPLKQVFPR